MGSQARRQAIIDSPVRKSNANVRMLLEFGFSFVLPWWMTPIGVASGSLTALLVMVMGVTWACKRHRAWTIERRIARRRRGDPVNVIAVHAAEPRLPVGNATVIDRSLTGLGLCTSEPVAIGTQLDIRPQGTPDTVPWARVEVVSSVKEAQTWRLGCAFVGLPAWRTLRLFG